MSKLFVVLEFPRPLSDATGRPTRETRGWFPKPGGEASIADAIQRGAILVGATADPDELEQMLAAGDKEVTSGPV